MRDEVAREIQRAAREVLEGVGRGVIVASEARARIIATARARAKGKRKGWSEARIQKSIKARMAARSMGKAMPGLLRSVIKARGKNAELVKLAGSVYDGLRR